MKDADYASLNDVQRALLDEAARAMDSAYAPYSGFSVGAALLTPKGDIINGSNVENAAYGSSICAERAALLRANAMGCRHFLSLAVIARGKDFETTAVTGPCGACRQMIFEASQLSGNDIEIILSTTSKDRIILTGIEELFPLGFGPKDLGVDLEPYT